MSTSFFFLVSDIFERTIENQTSEYVEHPLNLLLCGFQKADSVKLAPLKFLSSWQKRLDKLGPVLYVQYWWLLKDTSNYHPFFTVA